MDLKPFVDYLLNNNISKEKALEIIKNSNKLSDDEKNLVYVFCYPRPLLDYELPSRVQAYRTKKNFPMVGHIEPHLGEAALIVEAGRTPQYTRFIKHLIHAFSDPTKLAPLDGDEDCDCPICGKTTFQNNKWQNLIKEGKLIDNNREYLAFGSTESSVTMCMDCLVQLMTAIDYLENMDPNYMNFGDNKNWNDINTKIN